MSSARRDCEDWEVQIESGATFGAGPKLESDGGDGASAAGGGGGKAAGGGGGNAAGGGGGGGGGGDGGGTDGDGDSVFSFSRGPDVWVSTI